MRFIPYLGYQAIPVYNTKERFVHVVRAITLQLATYTDAIRIIAKSCSRFDEFDIIINYASYALSV